MSDASPGQQDVLHVRNHLLQHLGRPTTVFEVRGSNQPGSVLAKLQIAHFSPKGPNGPGLFATCGASAYMMPDGRRIEGVLMLNPKPPQEAFGAIHRILSSFAIMAEARGQPVRVGELVRAGELLGAFSKMAAVVFMPPLLFPKAFHTLAFPDGSVMEIVWVLPVYESEAVVVLKHGPDTLLKLFAKERVDPLQTSRRPAIAIPGSRDAEVQKAIPKEPPKAAPPVVNQAKRGTGSSSVQVLDDPDGVQIVRRNAKDHALPALPPKKKSFAPPPPPAPEEPKPAEPPPGQRRPLAPRRGPLGRAAPPEEPKAIRFDLSAPDESTAQRRPIVKKKRKAIPVKRRQVMSAEEEAEAKRKKVEELKAKAAEAAKRASERGKPGGGDPPKDQ